MTHYNNTTKRKIKMIIYFPKNTQIKINGNWKIICEFSALIFFFFFVWMMKLNLQFLCLLDPQPKAHCMSWNFVRKKIDHFSPLFWGKNLLYRQINCFLLNFEMHKSSLLHRQEEHFIRNVADTVCCRQLSSQGDVMQGFLRLLQDSNAFYWCIHGYFF